MQAIQASKVFSMPLVSLLEVCFCSLDIWGPGMQGGMEPSWAAGGCHIQPVSVHSCPSRGLHLLLWAALGGWVSSWNWLIDFRKEFFASSPTAQINQMFDGVLRHSGPLWLVHGGLT